MIIPIFSHFYFPAPSVPPWQLLPPVTSHFLPSLFMPIKYNKTKSAPKLIETLFYNEIFKSYFANSSAIAAPISAGLSTTRIPHSRMIFILAAAVSSAPPTIAPAWPILRPGGAV